MRDRDGERLYERRRGAARSPPRRGGGERDTELVFDRARLSRARGGGDGDLECDTERDRDLEDVLARRRLRALSLRTGDRVRDRLRDLDREYDGDREYDLDRDLDLVYDRPRLAARSPRGRGERDREYDRDDPVYEE